MGITEVNMVGTNDFYIRYVGRESHVYSKKHVSWNINILKTPQAVVNRISYYFNRLI